MDAKRVTQPPEENRLDNEAMVNTIKQLQARLAELNKQASELQKRLDDYLNVADPSAHPRE